LSGNIHPELSSSFVPRGGALVRFNRAGDRPMLILMDSCTLIGRATNDWSHEMMIGRFTWSLIAYNTIEPPDFLET
jgi:hypothetical protein